MPQVFFAQLQETSTEEFSSVKKTSQWLIEIEHGLTSAPTQYRLYGRRVFSDQKTNQWNGQEMT